MEIMDSCGRKEYMRKEYMQEDGWTVEPRDLACLMQYGYLNPLRAGYPDIPVVPVFNQADVPEQVQLARGILDSMGETNGIVCGQLRNDPSGDIF